ncbi:MAG: protein translocase subunit SecF [Allosphingosinicella sp.]|uniref:protein translocase subunit SecF n=1 Tax=Allosphingosinicella sp. TaxID=2823234 RepID=UPI00393DA0DF
MRLLKLVPETTNIGFVRWRNVAMLISLLMIIGSVALVATRGLNLGIDFVGGQSMRVTFQESPPLDQLRSQVSGLGYGEGVIQEEFGTPGAQTEGHTVTIRMPLPQTGGEEAANVAAQQLRQLVEQGYPGARIESVETVSGKVSNELFRAGGLSLLFAMIAISIYIWVRFEWQFGVGALFALFHDVALTFGFFALTQLEFNLNIVAALLTIIGYSLNDTIVVYDRIRENLRKYRKMAIEPLLDLSINETLARTIMTSLSMLIALFVLLMMGPDVIFGFVAAILLGIIIGTYSSVYMAAPILIWLKVGPHSFLPKDAGPAERMPAGRNEGYDGAQV